jgi:hypothetical protein
LASSTVGHVLFASSCTASIWTHDDCQQSSNLCIFFPVPLKSYHTASLCATCLLTIIHPYSIKHSINRVTSTAETPCVLHTEVSVHVLYYTQVKKHGIYYYYFIIHAYIHT